jgi:hypothetical protein
MEAVSRDAAPRVSRAIAIATTTREQGCFMHWKTSITSAVLAAACASSSLLAGGVNPEWSIARQWDEETLQAIRLATPRPPIHARNLYHMSSAMYDAWAAYDPTARGVFFFEKHTAKDVEAARHTAISYAAYRILKARFVAGNGPNIAQIQANLDALFLQLGYDKNFTSTAGNSPAAIGNRIAATILGQSLADGSNEVANYAPNNGYVVQNTALPFKIPGCVMQNPNRWQPLAFDFLVLQNGEIVGAAIQNVICPHWNGVKPFALSQLVRSQTNNLYYDQGAPPTIGQPAHIADAADMILKSALLDPRDPTTIDISPAVYHNSPLGSYEHQGYDVNPYTGKPYASNVIKRADYLRILAEYWADGPDSETPPGHWHVVANDASDEMVELGLPLAIRGEGAPVDRLEWDVKMYMGMSGANHDAAITSWGMKGYYDSARPISFTRYLGELGQSTDPNQPSYHPAGLPLIPGFIEIIQPEDVLPGGRFEDFPEIVYDPLLGEPIGTDTFVGKLAIKTWLGGFYAGTTTGSTTTGPLPGHVYRGAGDTWVKGSFYLGVDDSPGALNPGQTSFPSQIRINEIRIDQTGNDPDQYVELIGPPGASLDGLTYLVVGDEVQTGVPEAQGHIQNVISLDGQTLDENGLFVVAKTNFSLGKADLTTHFSFRQIGNCTHMLVSGFNGYLGQELDFLDDGIIDIEPWTAKIDSLGLRRKAGAVGIYAPVSIGPDTSGEQLFGTGWVQADRWMPYQASNFVTPPFPGFTSGHSTYSRSAAEFLTAYTGSAYFPGGLKTKTFPAGWLRFEDGPETDVTFTWATYFDAADEAGVSRIWGGIHPRADDLPGRVSGALVGKRAAAKAFALYEGLANSPDLNVDGDVGPADIALLLGAWGGNASSGGDLDGDGTVGPSDLAIILGAWGPA